MTRMTTDERFLGAIFGPKDEAEAERWARERVAAQARQAAKDREAALALCAEAAEKCSFGKTAGAQWLPALIYDNPAAIAILASGEVVQAHVQMGGYATLDKYDIDNTEVFND